MPKRAGRLLVVSIVLALALPADGWAQISLAGTWHFTLTGTTTFDDGSTEPFEDVFEEPAPSIAVSQDGAQLSGEFVVLPEIFDPLPCDLSCSAGGCTLDCGSTQCTVQCGGGDCAERTFLHGTVSGQDVQFTLTEAESITASCAGAASGTLSASDSSHGVFTGVAALEAGQRVITGTFQLRADSSCRGTGDFADVLECIGSTTVGSFRVVVDPAAGADLAVEKTVEPDTVAVGARFEYRLTVTNHGPAPATGVVLDDLLPEGVEFVSATPPCQFSAGRITCPLGPLSSGARVDLAIALTRTAPGTICNTATVDGAEPDPEAGNNHDTVCINGPPPPPFPIDCQFTEPSVVHVSGRQLIVQRRRLDGGLEPPQPYRIHGVNWAPASRGSGADDRQAQHAVWHAVDIPMMKEMNVNTVRVYLDFGAGLERCAVLDELHRHGIMAIVTADRMVNDTANIDAVVSAYRNHPAVLMWSLGNEWNINRYFGAAASVEAAAAATQAAAVRIKALDTAHPVATSLGDIDIPDLTPLATTAHLVNTVAPAVDVWGLNVYRGASFGSLFDQWVSISTKPMFIGEFGTDAFDQRAGAEDQVAQAAFDLGLWEEIAARLSADDPRRPALGGLVFEWNDEWWKAGSPATHDTGGSPSGGHPDGFANEEWFGVVDIDRNRRHAFFRFKFRFGGVASVPQVGLLLNRAAFGPGDPLRVETIEMNAGPPIAVDKYFGVVLPPAAGSGAGCPGGDAVAFIAGGSAVLRCLSDAFATFVPFAAGVEIPGGLPLTAPVELLGAVWPGGLPAGTYVWFIAYLRAGTTELAALSVQAMTYTP